jgi:hypothetical protein
MLLFLPVPPRHEPPSPFNAMELLVRIDILCTAIIMPAVFALLIALQYDLTWQRGNRPITSHEAEISGGWCFIHPNRILQFLSHHVLGAHMVPVSCGRFYPAVWH